MKIQLEGVAKAFPAGAGEIRALEAVDLGIREGEFVSILGESGCGKTTLLRITAGLIEPTSGRVTLDGTAVTKPRREMGFVFQQSVLLDWRTVMENVLLPVEILRLSPDGFRSKARELLDLVGLRDFEGSYPVQLSGGMQQRVAIAQVIEAKSEPLSYLEFKAYIHHTNRDCSKVLTELMRLRETLNNVIKLR